MHKNKIQTEQNGSKKYYTRTFGKKWKSKRC